MEEHPNHPTRKHFFLNRFAIAMTGLAGALFAPTSSPAQSRMKVVEESQTHTSLLGISSEYLAAQAVPGPSKPIVMAGSFDLEVTFPGATIITLIGAAGVDSVFAGVLDFNGTDWEVGFSPLRVDKLQPMSALIGPSATSEMRDLAVVNRTRYYVTGIIDDGTFFQNRNGTNFVLTAAAVGDPQRGFVATGSDGTFLKAHYVDATIQPVACATDPAGTILVIAGQERDAAATDFEGDDARIHLYNLPLPAGGIPLPAPNSISDPELADLTVRDVVVRTDGRTMIGGTKSGIGKLGGISDVWIARADFPGDQLTNVLRAGSEGTDRLFKMERGSHGETFVAFTVSGRDVSLEGLSFDLDTTPTTTAPSTHAFLGMIKSDGTPGWLSPLGLSQAPGGSMVPVDISVDAGGNTYVTVQASGTFLVEGIAQTLTGASQITVNGKGRVVDFAPTAGVADANCGAVPNIENRFVLGQTGAQSSFSTIESLAAPQTSHVVCFQDPNNPANTIDALSAIVTATGAQVHLETNFTSSGTVSVSIWATRDQLSILNDNPVLKVMADPLIIAPDSAGFGEVSQPDWALARLFDPFLVGVDDPSVSYYYPSGFVTPMSMERVARVYVMDKGLGAIENFAFQDLGAGGGIPIDYDGNGLCVDALAHPVEDGENVPDTSSDHPRQVVNLMAASDLGTAQGTAMKIFNVDMYTGAATEEDNCLTFASYVSYGILEALDHAELEDEDPEVGALPTIIVIASSGEDPGDQVNIEGAIDQALMRGIPVILSAGNGNNGVPQPVANFVPAMHGVKDGVITVGATALVDDGGVAPTLANLNPLYPSGNTDGSGTIISLYAPGAGVETGFGSPSGTSFSCGLVAGLAATYMSQHPASSPADLESALIAMSAYDPDREINIARSVCTFGAWLFNNGLGDLATCPDGGFGADPDGDGDDNLNEFLGGSDPNDATSRALIPSGIQLKEGTIAQLSVWLPDLLVSDDDSTLHTGCWEIPFEVQLSDNLQNWIPAEGGTLTVQPATDGLQELRFELDLDLIHQERCFLRFAFGPPLSP